MTVEIEPPDCVNGAPGVPGTGVLEVVIPMGADAVGVAGTGMLEIVAPPAADPSGDAVTIPQVPSTPDIYIVLSPQQPEPAVVIGLLAVISGGNLLVAAGIKLRVS